MMADMNLLAHLLSQDPAAPRLTVYNETTGARLDFSAQTLDNWAAKVANMLYEELDLEPGSHITIDLPVGWQAVAIALGALAAGVQFSFEEPTSGDSLAHFTNPDRAAETDINPEKLDVILVTDDPFGRGVEETGGVLPAGMIDFGPTVRFYGDQFFGDSPALAEHPTTWETGARVLSTGWTDNESFDRVVLQPLAAGGSAVIVAGLATEERLESIGETEKVTVRA